MGLFMALPKPWELSIAQQDLWHINFLLQRPLLALQRAKVVYTSASAWKQEQMLHLRKSLMVGLGTKKAKIRSLHDSLCICHDMRISWGAEASMSKLICKRAAGKLRNS